MALIKNFKEGTKYYYAVISNISLQKNARGYLFGEPHQMQVLLSIRDTEDPEFSEIENELIYHVPSVKIKKEKQMVVVPKINQDTGEQLVDDGKPVTEKVSNGEKEVIDDTYKDPFDISVMNKAKQNIVKLGYEWLKNNVELFSDFEDQ